LIGTLVVVVPITTQKSQELFKRIEAQGAAKAGGRAVVFPAANMAQVTAVTTAMTAAFSALIGSVYPAIALWYLTRPRARAACLARSGSAPTRPGEPKGPGEPW
jgi:hypothetical protein